jgi:hypothetical protein
VTSTTYNRNYLLTSLNQLILYYINISNHSEDYPHVNAIMKTVLLDLFRKIEDSISNEYDCRNTPKKMELTSSTTNQSNANLRRREEEGEKASEVASCSFSAECLSIAPARGTKRYIGYSRSTARVRILGSSFYFI